MYHGKHGGMTSNRHASRTGIGICVPCGQCVGCRLERSRQWAMRCLHEKRLHRDNVFITLTYANEFLPPGGTLVLRDLQLFMKRLRNLKGPGVRFYACGEYGDYNARPHYHALLFNCRFGDAKFFKENGRGEKLYTSQELRTLWPQGHNVLGEVTFESAAYVARYVMKKVTGKPSAGHYAVIDGNGEVFDRLPEFTVMSRRPGIGLGWFKKYGAETYAHDSCIVNGKEVRPPRYYDTKFEELDPEALERIKLVRRRKARLFLSDNTPDRRHVKEVLLLKKLKTGKRNI